MKFLQNIGLAAILALFLLTGCSGDNKEQKKVEPAPTTDPPKDVKPKIIDKKPVGFQ